MDYKEIDFLSIENASDSDIEMASIVDQSDEFLSDQEMEYYLYL